MFLQVNNISKQFEDKQALADVSFSIEAGKIYGLLGPNGAGKTTLIRIITQIFYPDSGTVFFDGEPLLNKHLNQIGYMPEERGLYKKMKVGEHLQYFAQLRNFSKNEAKERIDFYIKKFEIESWLNKEIVDLSKGMQQKVQFIATILHRPKLLILDEPFSGLDPINSEVIKDAIFELNNNGTTVLFSTHRMENVEEICSDIILMNQGKKILEGKVSDIKQQFKNNLYRINFSKAIEVSIFPVDVEIQEKGLDFIVIKLSEHINITQLLKKLIDIGMPIVGVHEILPSIHQIFIQQVNKIEK
ncbi:MAG: ATP-binding cassette domain-containing protein [Chitinophagales bacterium]|nr:ATP-binding cassette domain-containing protein [Chitinophagales bacterium]MCB0511273.1 ATP-binding cassette domain-containing protein [Bacteroidota bacterium]MCB9075044.1 ABC transporter ATP-binding protein [Chitinophagales bacterium]HNG09517.1 ATP-binding cassette domain-containing protein [Chitinophagales bacterium]HNL17293.1 ATP-binding cassette domain-containing protein [Chitinophagales bacterium]